jgi:hypothetical protein
MPSALRFRVPVQGQGIGGGVGQESGVEWSHVYNLAGAANGYTKWSRQWNLTGFTHDTEFHVRTRNQGSGGRHQRWEKSTDASTIATMTDAGLSAATPITSTVATGTAPFVVASTTVVANLNAAMVGGSAGPFLPLTGGILSGDLDLENLEVNGDASIDGSAVVNVDLAVDGDFDVDGDSDLQIVRLTPDPSANPQLLFRANSSRTYWGLGGSNSATPNFQLFNDVGGVMTEQFEITQDGLVNAKSMEVYAGNLLVTPVSSEVAIRIRYEAGDGVFTLGATNSANPSLLLKNNAGIEVARFTDGGSLTIPDGGINVALSSVFSDDVSINGELSVGSDGISSDGNNVFGNGSGDTTLINGTLNMGNNFDLGDGIPTSTNNSTGYWAVDFGGSTRYIPLYNSP